MQIKSFKFFYPEKPTLMVKEQPEFEEMSNDPNWIAELKYNGQRCCLHILDGKVEFWGRHGKKLKYNDNPNKEMVKYLTKKFPVGYFLFDAELRHNKTVGVRDKIVIWDVFIFRNEFLNKEQYWTRRAILKNRIGLAWDDTQNAVKLIEQYPHSFNQVYDRVIKNDEIEGLVLKNLRGKLNISRTSASNSTWMWKVRKPSGRYKF